MIRSSLQLKSFAVAQSGSGIADSLLFVLSPKIRPP